MYKTVNRQNSDWGTEGYQVPVLYFDHMKQLKEKEYIEAQKKGKFEKAKLYVTKRGNF
jgi:hypothetical protein